MTQFGNNGDAIATVSNVRISPHSCAYDLCAECSVLRDDGWRQAELWEHRYEALIAFLDFRSQERNNQ